MKFDEGWKKYLDVFNTGYGKRFEDWLVSEGFKEGEELIIAVAKTGRNEKQEAEK